MGRFVAEPDTLIQKGNEIEGGSQSFFEEIDKVYKTKDEMIAKDYLSPEARAIARKMDDQRKDLEEIARVMAQYGNFSKRAGHKVLQNQDNITSEIQ